MIQVWLYDENKVFIESTFVEEILENMTTVPLLVGYITPTFNEELQEWYEGATQEEIDKWHEDNKPLPSEPSTEDKMEVLKAKVAEQDVTCANLLLEIALLKGGPQNVV